MQVRVRMGWLSGWSLQCAAHNRLARACDSCTLCKCICAGQQQLVSLTTSQYIVYTDHNTCDSTSKPSSLRTRLCWGLKAYVQSRSSTRYLPPLQDEIQTCAHVCRYALAACTRTLTTVWATWEPRSALKGSVLEAPSRPGLSCAMRRCRALHVGAHPRCDVARKTLSA